MIKQLGKAQVDKWKKDSAIQYCIATSKWMFQQKDKYIQNILQDLQQTNGEYPYGIKEDAFVFDVPGYGQFSVHMGKNNAKQIRDLQQVYQVGEYKGDFLGDVYILSKADPELLSSADYDELSDLDKQRYKIATQKIGEKNKSKQQKRKTLESIMEHAKDKTKAEAIVKVLREEGIQPEEIVTETLLEKGKPSVVQDIIKIFKEYGIELNTLMRCKTLLAVTEEKAIDVMGIFDKIQELGLDFNIITESPNFLTVSKSDKLEPIYEVLKQYHIDLTNHNIAVAFEGAPQNIKKNMDLVIENGLYDLAQTGVNKFFTANYKNLNMRLNLWKQHNAPIVREAKGKRTISAKVFQSEKDLMRMYGIEKKEVLEELSKIQGQELIQDSRYTIEEKQQNTIDLKEQQQELSNSIYAKLQKYQMEDGLVLKIGDYFYSSIKVKQQLDTIIANYGITSLDGEDINEILKVALLKNKNIDKKEVEEISAYLEELTKEEILQETEQSQTVQQVNIPQIRDTEREENIVLSEEDGKQEKMQEKANKFQEIKNRTNNIVAKEQDLQVLKQEIERLKAERKVLKEQIKQMEEEINKQILQSETPSEKVIEEIKTLQSMIHKQKQQRQKIKQIIRTHKEKKKQIKTELKQDRQERDVKLEDLEL